MQITKPFGYMGLEYLSFIIKGQILYLLSHILISGFPGGSESKESACNTEDPGQVTGLGRSPGEGNGNPLQYSCLENQMDRGVWQTTVHGVTKYETHLSN